MSNPQDAKSLFDEIAIADLQFCQIAVPTTTQTIKRCMSLGQMPMTKRIYQTQGWLIHNHQIVAHLDELKLGQVRPQNSLFTVIQRLAPAIPISFEVRSSQPLPEPILSQATFACELSKADFPYHMIFRHRLPRFVRIYPLRGKDSLLDRVKQMLLAEDAFIAQNYKLLKRIPFYQNSFGL